MFIEVTSVEKACPIIVNLDRVVEIAPLRDGGCALFIEDGAGMNSRSAIVVKEGYDLFRQFAMQTVTADMIEARFPKKQSVEKVQADVNEPVQTKKASKKSEGAAE